MSKTLHIALIPLAALLALSGCAAATPDASAGGGASQSASAAPEETTAAAPETACPDGFVAAWGAAAAPNYGADFTFREATVDEFAPAFLAPFLDGGCAIYASGTNIYSGSGGVHYVGVAPEAATLADVTTALDKAGYTVADPSTPAFFNGPDGTYASAFLVGGDVHTDGDAAFAQFFPTGVVFY